MILGESHDTAPISLSFSRIVAPSRHLPVISLIPLESVRQCASTRHPAVRALTCITVFFAYRCTLPASLTNVIHTVRISKSLRFQPLSWERRACTRAAATPASTPGSGHQWPLSPQRRHPSLQSTYVHMCLLVWAGDWVPGGAAGTMAFKHTQASAPPAGLLHLSIFQLQQHLPVACGRSLGCARCVIQMLAVGATRSRLMSCAP